ncbi:MAG: anti-sigma factor family protein [Bryobacteraceae bacterium]
MHGSIRDRLEDLLSGERPVAGHKQATEHLASCERCASELALMKGQSALLRELRAPADMEAPPGFYARVMQRIEERAKDSIWGVFIDSAFGKRLAYASFAIALALGTYVVTAELRDGHLGGERIVAQQFSGGAVVTGNLTERRDAVLVDFASYQPDRQPYQQGSPQ